jgi:WD40 repeat protein
MMRWTFDGDVRTWDLASGQLERTYKHQPPRSMLGGMQLSPDGNTFVTFEELPGTYEGHAKRAASLWDVRTGKYRPLPDGCLSIGRFSPSGRDLATASADADGFTCALKLIDGSTAREKLSISIKDKFVLAYIAGFSPDGRLMVGEYRRFDHRRKREYMRSFLKCWDSSTGREVLSFVSDKNDEFLWPRFSPDGQTIAAVSWNKGNLFLFDVPEKKLRRTAPLMEKPEGERVDLTEPAFHPDGKQLAVIAQHSLESVGQELDAHDVAQARIFLIDLPSGNIRETLVTPQGLPRSACFSPDGRTLATGGEGRVLLWDVANALGSVERSERPDDRRR